MWDNKKSFIVYCDYAEHLDLLTDEECGQLFKALCAYAGEGKQPENFNSCQKMAFSFIKKQIDRDTEKYNKVIEKRREAGKRAADHQKHLKQMLYPKKQKKQMLF
ncbi:MAG: DUF6291 domain-containing protein [Clostridiales bacterium]|nr:DUF6291 domain-containing protein [Clostridiales bacterium]